MAEGVMDPLLGSWQCLRREYAGIGVAQMESWFWAEAQGQGMSGLESLQVLSVQGPAWKRADLLKLL